MEDEAIAFCYPSQQSIAPLWWSSGRWRVSYGREQKREVEIQIKYLIEITNREKKEYSNKRNEIFIRFGNILNWSLLSREIKIFFIGCPNITCDNFYYSFMVFVLWFIKFAFFCYLFIYYTDSVPWTYQF